jgi:stalled ribosome alternative rescue factor ArfA
MSKSKPKVGSKNKASSMVMVPLYQSRVQRDVKNNYSRKEKHRSKPSSEGFLFIGMVA